MARDWRKHIHPELREHLEREIRRTFEHKRAYDNADNKGNAQLWIAVGNIAKQLNKIEKRLNEMESMAKEMGKESEKGFTGFKDFKDDDKEEVSFIETPLMGGLNEVKLDVDEREMDVGEIGEIKLPEMDEIKELVEKGDELMQDVSKGTKKKSLGKKSTKKILMKKPSGKKLSDKKKLKKSLKRF